MSKFFKPIALLVSASLMIGLLAGCGENKSNADGNTQSTQQTKKSKITLAYWDYTTTRAYMQEQVKTFMDKNPDIEVDVQDMTGKDYPDKLAIMLAGGENVDVYGIKNGGDFNGYVGKKQLKELDQYIQKDSYDTKNYGGVEEQLKSDGKTYALPVGSDFWITFFNKNLFDKAKVSYPTNDMTWDDYREMAKKLTSGSGGDKVYGTYFHTWSSPIHGIVTPANLGSLESGDYAYLKQAYQLVYDMQNVDKSAMTFAEAKTSNAAYLAMFESGKNATVTMGSWMIASLINDKKAGKFDFDWGIVKAPHLPGVPAGSTIGNVTGIGINSNTKQADNAWAFVKFLAGEEAAKITAKNGQFPAYKNEQILSTISNIDGFPKDGAEALKTAKVYPDTPLGAKGSAIAKIIDEQTSVIMTGAKSIDAGLEELSKRVKEEVLNAK